MVVHLAQCWSIRAVFLIYLSVQAKFHCFQIIYFLNHLDPTPTFQFTQYFQSTPEYRPQIGSKINRRSRPEVLLVKSVLEICSHFNEITLRHECSPVNFLNIFRKPFSKKTFGWLLLHQVTCLANLRSKIDFVEDFRNCTVLFPFPFTPRIKSFRQKENHVSS